MTPRRRRRSPARRPIRLPGHKLTITWSGEYGQESSSTGTCLCGWEESGSSREIVRDEYHFHMKREEKKQHAFEDRLRSKP